MKSSRITGLALISRWVLLTKNYGRIKEGGHIKVAAEVRSMQQSPEESPSSRSWNRKDYNLRNWLWTLQPFLTLIFGLKSYKRTYFHCLEVPCLWICYDSLGAWVHCSNFESIERELRSDMWVLLPYVISGRWDCAKRHHHHKVFQVVYPLWQTGFLTGRIQSCLPHASPSINHLCDFKNSLVVHCSHHLTYKIHFSHTLSEGSASSPSPGDRPRFYFNISFFLDFQVPGFLSSNEGFPTHDLYWQQNYFKHCQWRGP